VVFIYFFISFFQLFPSKVFLKPCHFFKRNFFSKFAGAHFFSKKYTSFSGIALLVLETIAQILSRNSATQHVFTKKSDQNLAEKKQKSDQN